jgi:thiol-disulfide isomerase/thioredoxin
MSYKCSFPAYDEKCFDESKKKVFVVDVYSKSCGPCRSVAPSIDKIAEKYSDSVRFFGLDSKEESRVADRWNIESLPTFVVFVKDGRKIKIFEKVDSKYLGKRGMRHYCDGLEYALKNAALAN